MRDIKMTGGYTIKADPAVAGRLRVVRRGVIWSYASSLEEAVAQAQADAASRGNCKPTVK